MSLPVPNLDDRRFQDLVDDAKRHIQRHCPEWTDHNVSDPGVTLVEAMAQMVDQLLYRLNRVPDKLYVKFLDLIGVQLFPPAAAICDVTFWLAAPRDTAVTVPADTRVSTRRHDRHDRAVVFSTTRDLVIPPTKVTHAIAVGAGGDPNAPSTRHILHDITSDGARCFGTPPRAGDSFVVGLDRPAPSCAVLLRIGSEIEGIGVDPEDPPLAWEAYDGFEWLPCELDRDSTGGMNRPGEVVLHVPARHHMAVLGGESAAWIRCRVTEPGPDQPFYSASPMVKRLQAMTLGATTGAVHAEIVRNEVIGVSEGVAGQRFRVAKAPIVSAGTDMVIEVSGPDGWERWQERIGFGRLGPDDKAFTLDPTLGEISFGPTVRLEDGSARQYGAIPPKGASIRVPEYRSGGGAAGNVSARSLTMLQTPIPYIGRVENRLPAEGGVDGEDIENAKERGPIRLRALGRAVTPQDYVHLAHREAPEAARIHCVPSDADNGVRVLVVPAAASDEHGRLDFETLVPPEEMLQRIAHVLEQRRTVGARVVVEPPVYHGITVVCRLRARHKIDEPRVRLIAQRTLYRYLHPILGGHDGDGWTFGQAVHLADVFAILQKVREVEAIEEVKIFPADPITGARGEESDRIDIGRDGLVFSYHHQVRVESAGL